MAEPKTRTPVTRWLNAISRIRVWCWTRASDGRTGGMYFRLARLGVLPRFASQAPALQEHLAILDALARRDTHAAVEALAHHLDQARMRALGLV